MRAKLASSFLSRCCCRCAVVVGLLAARLSVRNPQSSIRSSQFAAEVGAVATQLRCSFSCVVVVVVVWRARKRDSSAHMCQC